MEGSIKNNGYSETPTPFDRLGDILVSLGHINRKTLEHFIYQEQTNYIASNKQHHTSIEKLVTKDRHHYVSGYNSYFIGERLVAAKLIINEQLEQALSLQKDLKSSFPDIPKNKLILVPEILHKISRSKNIYSILNLIMDYCNKVVGAEASTLFLHNKERNTLIFDVSTGVGKNFLTEKELSVNEGVAGWVFQNNKSTIVNDVVYDKRFCSNFDKDSGFQTRNILCVPIRVNAKAEGALEVINKIGNKPFNKNDECLLQILSNQVGIHLENRVLMEGLRGKADQLEKEKNKYQCLLSEKEKLLNQLSQTLEDLKSNQKELMETYKFKGIAILAAGAAHDFNNLLTAILGKVEIFKYKELKENNHLSEKGVDALHKTFKEVMNLCMQAKHLTANLVRLGKQEVVKKEAVNIESFLPETIKPLERQFSTRGIQLKITFLSAIPKIILAKGHFCDMITNLAINALHAIEERQLHLRSIQQNPEMYFTIKVDQKDDFLIMEFIDTGIGIPSDNIKKVFEPFFSTKKQTIEKGTGLGLTMVRRTVDLHDGHLVIRSITQEMIDKAPKTYLGRQCGTAITIRIPMVKAFHDQLETPVEIKSFQQQSETLVYIAEDEKDIKDFLCTVIPEFGLYQVRGFDNGKLLIDAVKVKTPDLIITDIQMPEMDGLTLCREINRICHKNKKPAIIISTGRAEKDNLEPFFALGVRETLEKPYTLNELMTKISHASLI